MSFKEIRWLGLDGWRRCHRIFLGMRCRGYIVVICWTTLFLRLAFLISFFKVDHGEWYPDKGVYHRMMQVEHDEPIALKNLIRNKVAPLNVSLFSWMLLNI